MNAHDTSPRTRFFPPVARWLPAGAVALALVAAFAAGRANLSAAPRATTAATASTPSRMPASSPAPPFPGSYSAIVDQVAPSVVTIRVDKGAVTADGTRAGDLWRFFGRDPGERLRGLGSGVIVDASGYVLTNHHVVEDARRILVDLADRRSVVATVVGVDPPSDLALLRIKADGLRAIAFGDADRVRVGDVVLAFGNPLGVGQTVTMGIVSAKGRATGVGDGNYEDFLQTDAPINQGNSGGALVDLQGNLVGINSQILSSTGGNIGIGFAIPSTMARAVTDQLMKDGVVRRARLGVTVQPMNADLAQSLGLDGVRGALVSAVEPGSPADAAGLRQGDVITQVDGHEVTDANALRNHVAGSRPGAEVSLTLARDGAARQVTARLAERPREGAQAASRMHPGEESEEGRVGLAVEPLTPSLARDIGAPPDQTGLLVTDVDPAGTAAEAGVRPGDLIKRVDGRPVTSVRDLRSRLAASQERPALLLIGRRGGDLFVALPRSAS